eukprot:758839-Hanusia_phi.AAC.2
MGKLLRSHSPTRAPSEFLTSPSPCRTKKTQNSALQLLYGARPRASVDGLLGQRASPRVEPFPSSAVEAIAAAHREAELMKFFLLLLLLEEFQFDLLLLILLPISASPDPSSLLRRYSASPLLQSCPTAFVSSLTATASLRRTGTRSGLHTRVSIAG